MSKKTTAATTVTTNNTTAMSKKEETTMKKTTNATTSPMTAADFKQKSYDAYLAYVAFIEGKKSAVDTVTALSPLMTAYGLTLTVDNLANVLTVKMTNFGKDKGEKAKKVKSISTFRSFVKEGWKEVEAAPVHSNAGKNPADVKPKKAKSATKAELESANADLLKRLAEMEAKLTAATATTNEAPATETPAAAEKAAA